MWSTNVQADVFQPEVWRSQLQGGVGVVSCLGAFGSNDFMLKVSASMLVLTCFMLRFLCGSLFASVTPLQQLSSAVLGQHQHTSSEVADKLLSPSGTTCNHLPSQPVTVILPLWWAWHPSRHLPFSACVHTPPQHRGHLSDVQQMTGKAHTACTCAPPDSGSFCV